jgi:hypothetical protein
MTHLLPIAAFTTAQRYEILGLIGILASVAGIWMQTRRSHFDSDAEEAVKDGKLTEADARRRMKLIGWSTTVLTLTGVACLIFAGWELFR